MSDSKQGSRRLLLEKVQFIEANVMILSIMGACILLYIMSYLLSERIGNIFVNYPKLQYYVKQIATYISARFKWVYFDMLIWISYIPFLYFSLRQVKSISFTSALSSISSLVSLVILALYPLYPVLIFLSLRKNFALLCQKHSAILKISLSPWINGVKIPEN